MQLRRRPERRGFTLPEVLVSTTILILLAAMTVPSLVSYKNAKDARAVASLLTSLSLSLNNPNGSLGDLGFAQRIGDKYPQQLIDLVAPITTAKFSCSGGAYTTTNVNAWAAGAPYSNAPIFLTGIPTPAGSIRDTVYTSATTNYVELRMDSVETIDAQNIDLAVDLTADSTQGVIRYEAEPSAPTNVQLHRIRYLIPKGNGC